MPTTLHRAHITHARVYRECRVAEREVVSATAIELDEDKAADGLKTR